MPEMDNLSPNDLQIMLAKACLRLSFYELYVERLAAMLEKVTAPENVGTINKEREEEVRRLLQEVARIT